LTWASVQMSTCAGFVENDVVSQASVNSECQDSDVTIGVGGRLCLAIFYLQYIWLLELPLLGIIIAPRVPEMVRRYMSTNARSSRRSLHTVQGRNCADRSRHKAHIDEMDQGPGKDDTLLMPRSHQVKAAALHVASFPNAVYSLMSLRRLDMAFIIPQCTIAERHDTSVT
jgi:hypothetical protein